MAAGEEGVIELDDDEEPPCQAHAAGKINPLMAEITMLGGEKGKNDGGSKNWRCNHCKKAFKSSLTRVRVHLLGALPGKKAQIGRCPVLLNDAAKTREFREQFTHFISKKGIYALPSVKQDAYSMDAIDWWETYGSETPDLAAIAIKILSQPISSSSAERIWSTYEFVHSAKRNKLNAKNADKLVYVHSNLRLLSRVTESYKKGPHANWDVDPCDSTI